MHERVKRLKFVFYLPAVLGVLRLLATAVILFANPFGMHLRALQIIPALVIVGSLFMYLKLFSDNVPVVSLLVPSIAQFLLILAFRRVVELVPFILPLILDILFIVGKTFKASAFPFEFEGDEEEEDLLEDEPVSGEVDTQELSGV